MCIFDANKIDLEGKPMKVFKVFEMDKEKNVLRSPFYTECEWKEGETHRIIPPDDWVRPLYEERIKYDRLQSIGGLAYHCFGDIENAKDTLRFFEYTNPKGTYVIYECEIPADSAFVFVGTYNRNRTSYATQKLKVIKEIESYA